MKSEMLIILDLDETLIYATKEKLDHEPDFQVFDYYVYKRPYLNEFIDYLVENFELAIWTSSDEAYMNAIISKLNMIEQIQFAWGKQRTTLKKNQIQNSNGLNDTMDFIYIKRLKKVKKLGYKLQKVLMVDDSPSKVSENYGNAIYIKEFKGEANDQYLLKLIQYLKQIKDCEDVRKIEKRYWDKIN